MAAKFREICSRMWVFRSDQDLDFSKIPGFGFTTQFYRITLVRRGRGEGRAQIYGFVFSQISTKT